MRKLVMVVMLAAMANLATGCLATRKFTRNEVKTSSDTLNARIDQTDSQVKETADGVRRVDERVTTVDGKVAALDTKTAQRMDTLNTSIQGVDTKAGQAQTSAQRANTDIAQLDQKFQGRNNFTVASEKSILFKFDSAVVDDQYKTALEEIASLLKQNADALVVLEGRTDSSGNDEYNIRLGERRVEAVKRQLTVDMEIPVYRIHEISFGAARPVADNTSRDGREKNRAVILTVLVPQAGATASISSQQ
jgi:outer membrane protein OmpA-like peptidoglycan-associated protein